MYTSWHEPYWLAVQSVIVNGTGLNVIRHEFSPVTVSLLSHFWTILHNLLKIVRRAHKGHLHPALHAFAILDLYDVFHGQLMALLAEFDTSSVQIGSDDGCVTFKSTNLDQVNGPFNVIAQVPNCYVRICRASLEDYSDALATKESSPMCFQSEDCVYPSWPCTQVATAPAAEFASRVINNLPFDCARSLRLLSSDQRQVICHSCVVNKHPTTNV